MDTRHWPAPDCLHSIRAGEALPVTHGVLPVQTGYGLTDHLTENKTWSQDYQNIILDSCQYLPVRAHLRAEALEAGPQLLRLSLRGEILVTGNQL